MRHLWIVFALCAVAPLSRTPSLFAAGETCPSGHCPRQSPLPHVPSGLPSGLSNTVPVPSNAARGGGAASFEIDTRAVARIVNQQHGGRTLGSGTLVAADQARGLVITCAHLLREGTGQLSVTFGEGGTFAARAIKVDQVADLCALEIAAPALRPVELANAAPRVGDPLVSCGFGSDGRLWCNRGQALGYVSIVGGHPSETLELSGSARQGDSGGPVFNRERQLVAVLFGTNGQVVDATFCGRVRRFLSDLTPRCQERGLAPVAEKPAATPESSPSPSSSAPSLVETAPQQKAPVAEDTATARRLVELEKLAMRLIKSCQTLQGKLEEAASAVQPSTPSSNESRVADAVAPPAPTAEAPAAVQQPSDAINEIGRAAEPWLTARVTTLLIGLGVPAGAATLVAGIAVWVLMRRAKRRLQSVQRHSTATGEQPIATSVSGSDSPTTLERHHNRYVAYETSDLDRAWAAAHAQVGEKYPGAVPYLKLVEGVKDQLLSGKNNPQL